MKLAVNEASRLKLNTGGMQLVRQACGLVQNGGAYDPHGHECGLSLIACISGIEAQWRADGCCGERRQDFVARVNESAAAEQRSSICWQSAFRSGSQPH